MSFAGTWMKLEAIIFIKLTQGQETKHRMFWLISGCWIMRTHDTGEQHKPGPVGGWVLQYYRTVVLQCHIFTLTFLHLDIQILTIVLKLPAVSSIVICCTGLQPRSNRQYSIAQMCSRPYHRSLCQYTLWCHIMTKLPKDAFLRAYPHR